MTTLTRKYGIALRLLATVLALALSPLSSGAHSIYDPKALEQILIAVAADFKAGRTPIVVFDIDDTVMNVGSRNVTILKEFAALPEVRKEFPVEAALLDRIDLFSVQYSLANTLLALGIVNSRFSEKVTPFWTNRFFTSEYAAKDLVIPGAAEYANAVAKAGAILIYLSGRPEPTMKEGTEKSLRENGFPYGNEHALLLLKPDPKMPDLEFKKIMFQKINLMGHVDGAFENEPANVNAYLDAFPDATAVFLDTRSSQDDKVPPQQVQVRPEVHWVKTFLCNSALK